MPNMVGPTHNLFGIFWRPGKPPGSSAKLRGGIVPNLEVEGGIARTAAHSERVRRADREGDQ